MAYRSVVRVLLLLSVFLNGCFRQGNPERPNNVPPGAIYLQGTKGNGIWQSCEIKQEAQFPTCQIVNNGGEILYNEQFVLYSGSLPKSTSLVLTNKGGPQWIELENGAKLIPKSEKEQLTKFLDFLTGKSATFGGNAPNAPKK
jgi:hypothetical protein